LSKPLSSPDHRSFQTIQSLVSGHVLRYSTSAVQKSSPAILLQPVRPFTARQEFGQFRDLSLPLTCLQWHYTASCCVQSVLVGSFRYRVRPLQ